jgi:hypothetical protein
MRKLVLTFAVISALGTPAAFAMEHAGHDHSGHSHGSTASAAHEEVIDGVRATFSIQTMADAMKAMGMAMPKGVKETHHISVAFKDATSGIALTDGEVRTKLQGPDKAEQTKDLTGMQGHFGADFNMGAKGKYGVMSRFRLKDGKIRQVSFWYDVK